MKAPPFAYHRPDTLEAALALLDEHGDEAKVLAGGQSLIPLMGLRMGRPGHVVDIGAIPGLDRIDVADDGSVSIGALVRHEQAKRSDEVATKSPLVHSAMPWVAHRAIRTRGTVVGSIAHADPAAEMPAVVLATGATMTATSSSGSRTIAADDFFTGYLDTELAANEILTSVTFPTWPTNAGAAVVEEARRHGDYALVGLAAMITVTDGTVTDAALAFFGAAATAVRVTAAESALVDAPATPETFDAAATIVAAELDPPADVHGSTAYRKHLAGTLTRRGLDAALADLTARNGVPA